LSGNGNSVVVQLTNGFGNNVFQLVAARLLAEKHGRKVQAVLPWADYYGLNELSNVWVGGVEVTAGLASNQAVFVNDDNYAAAMTQDSMPDCNIVVRGHFEDYRYFVENRELIKSWFEPVGKTNDRDLVFHFRTGDRLFMRNEFEYKPSSDSYREAIESFDFDRLHIVSDLPELRRYTPEELGSLKFHNDVDASKSVGHEDAAEYLNSVVDALLQFEPVFEPASISEDFDKIRSFDNIMFEHGTMSWWAAFLSEASSIGVRKDWRPWKGHSNKNLSKVPIEGWFEWR